MLDRSLVKAIGARVATTTGYPSIVQRAINRAPIEDTVRVADGARVERGARLAGNVSLAAGARVETGSHLSGNVSVAKNAHVGPDSKVTGTVALDRYVNLTADVEFIGGEISVGGFTPVGRRTSFQAIDHSTHRPSTQWKFYAEVLDEELEMVSKGPIQVGSDVWIGMDATVLSGVEIGHGAVVGAGAIVTEDVEPYAIVAGVPAEHKGWRFDERIREQLLDVAWWEWDEDRMRQNKGFFTTDLRESNDVTELVR
jgi:virginiamycin A acetyltransferase